MNENEPNFDVDLKTGECDPPVGHKATPSTEVTQSTFENSQLATSNHSGVPQLRRSKPISTLRRPYSQVTVDMSAYSKQEGVLQVLGANFKLFSTTEGQLILVDQRLGMISPADSAYLVAFVQRCAHDQQATVSEGAIKAAVRVLRERGPIGEMDLMIGRVGYGFGRYQVRAHRGYWIYPLGGGAPEYQEQPYIPVLWPNKSLFSSFAPRQVNGPAALKALLFALPLDEDDQLLLLTWMVLVMMPRKRQILLELIGAPESGKSTLQAILKELLDPSTETLVRQLPKNTREVNELAKDHFLISLDNVSKLSPMVQRSLGNLMRGATIDWAKTKEFSTPLLTTCPVMLNGEESVITDTELKRHTLTLSLSSQYLKHPDWINTPLSRDHLLPDAFSGLAQLLGEVNAAGRVYLNDEVPAAWQDFYRVGVIVAHWLGKDANHFGRAFKGLQAIEGQDAVDDSPVATALIQYSEGHDEGSHTLTVKDWLEVLEPYCPDTRWHRSRWPERAKALGADFGRCEKLVANFGLRLESLGKRGSRCHWRLSKMEEPEQCPDFSNPDFNMFDPNRSAEWGNNHSIV